MSSATLVFDDDCGFCTWWAEMFEDYTETTILGFSEMDHSIRDRLPDDYENCAHLVTSDGVYSCGEAIEEAFVRSDIGDPARPLSERLRESEWYGDIREWGYHFVATNREYFGRLTPSSERN